MTAPARAGPPKTPPRVLIVEDSATQAAAVATHSTTDRLRGSARQIVHSPRSARISAYLASSFFVSSGSLSK